MTQYEDNLDFLFLTLHWVENFKKGPINHCDTNMHFSFWESNEFQPSWEQNTSPSTGQQSSSSFSRYPNGESPTV